MSKTTVKTIIKEYDDSGRLIKETETTTETEYKDAVTYPIYPYYPSYPSYPTQPWTAIY